MTPRRQGIAAWAVCAAVGGLLFLGPPTSQSAARVSVCPGFSSARVAFDRTWRAVRSFFGATGMPAPRLLFPAVRADAMRVQGGPGGFRRVEVLGVQREALAGERGCRERLAARESLIHEFVHVFQAEPWLSGEVRPDEIREEVPEGLAEAEAQWLILRVFHCPLGTYDDPVWATYDAYARQIRHEYPKSFIRRGQFGANWGHNPRLIPWEEPAPGPGPAPST